MPALSIHSDDRPFQKRPFQRRLLQSRLAKFAAVGFSGVFVNLGLLYLFAERAHLAEALASALAIELSILWNFFLNNSVTFRDRNADARSGFVARMVRYNLIGLVGLAIQLGIFLGLNSLLVRALHLQSIGLWRYPSQCVGIVIAMAWNFASNVWWTWGQRASR